MLAFVLTSLALLSWSTEARIKRTFSSGGQSPPKLTASPDVAKGLVGHVGELRLGMSPAEVSAVYPATDLRVTDAFGYRRAYIAPSKDALGDRPKLGEPTFVEVGFVDNELAFIYLFYGLGDYRLFEDPVQPVDSRPLVRVDPMVNDTVGARPRWLWARELSSASRDHLRNISRTSQWGSVERLIEYTASKAGIPTKWLEDTYEVGQRRVRTGAYSFHGDGFIITADTSRGTETIRLVDTAAWLAVEERILSLTPFFELSQLHDQRPPESGDFYNHEPLIPAFVAFEVTFAPAINIADATNLLTLNGIPFAWVELSQRNVQAWVLVPHQQAAFWANFIGSRSGVSQVNRYIGPVASLDFHFSFGPQSPRLSAASSVSPAIARERAIQFIRKQFELKGVVSVSDKGYSLGRVRIDNLRAEVLKSRNYWEKLTFTIIATSTSVGGELFVLLDAAYTSGLGNRPPAKESFQAMETHYYQEMDVYLQNFGSKLREFVVGGRQ